ncbi:hypothetical protein AV540_21335 [Brevibacillus parabrevis]|nr:hypothetical protein AV540_21335 [Brevibacillus parabrevis]
MMKTMIPLVLGIQATAHVAVLAEAVVVAAETAWAASSAASLVALVAVRTASCPSLEMAASFAPGP